MLLKKKIECLICFNDTNDKICFYNLLSNKSLCCSCFEKIEYKPRIINYKKHKITILYEYNEVLRTLIKNWKINKCFKSLKIISKLIKNHIPKSNTIIYPPSIIKKNQKTNLEKLLNYLNLKSKNIFEKNLNYEMKNTDIKKRKSDFTLAKTIPTNFYLIDDVYTSGATIKNAIKILEKYNHLKMNILIIASTKKE